MALLAKTDIEEGKKFTSISIHERRCKDPVSGDMEDITVLKLQAHSEEAGRKILDDILLGDECGIRSMYINTRAKVKYPCSVGEDGDIQLVFPSISALFGFLDKATFGESRNMTDVGFGHVIDLRAQVTSYLGKDDRGDRGV